jgi:hypothetical protein
LLRLCVAANNAAGVDPRHTATDIKKTDIEWGVVMNRVIVTILLLSVSASAFAAGKSCDELKTEIAAKLDGKQVKGYTLEIVASDAAGVAKVVGSCEGGAKKIVYSKS